MWELPEPPGRASAHNPLLSALASLPPPLALRVLFATNGRMGVHSNFPFGQSTDHNSAFGRECQLQCRPRQQNELKAKSDEVGRRLHWLCNCAPFSWSHRKWTLCLSAYPIIYIFFTRDCPKNAEENYTSISTDEGRRLFILGERNLRSRPLRFKYRVAFSWGC